MNMKDLGEKSKIEYRSIFLSDIHLGLNNSNVDLLLDFLDHVKCQNLYFVGDTIDFYHLYEHHGWSKKCNLIIRRILSKLRKGTKVNVCIGNHDAFLGVVNHFNFGDLSISKTFIHQGIFIDYLVLHGDKFDYSMKYKIIVKLLSYLHSHFIWFSFANWIKKKCDAFIEKNMDMNSMADYAKERKCYGIVFGHTHKPFCNNNEMGVSINNCGDWLENCTAIVETVDGQMELIKWGKLNKDRLSPSLQK